MKSTKQYNSAKNQVDKSNKNIKKTAYRATIKQIQCNMKTRERIFSNIIHNSIIEKISNAVGLTIARPTALICGSLVSLILTAIIYLMAKYYGWELSGSEWIASFILGWFIGLIIDWIRAAIFRRYR